MINPPQKKKRSYWTNEQLDADANQWLENSTEHPGSWWTDWSAWLKQYADREIAAPKNQGNQTYKPTEPAPGRYVKRRV